MVGVAVGVAGVGVADCADAAVVDTLRATAVVMAAAMCCVVAAAAAAAAGVVVEAASAARAPATRRVSMPTAASMLAMVAVE